MKSVHRKSRKGIYNHTEKKETHPELIALGIMLLGILMIDIMGYYHGKMTLLEVLKHL